MCQLAALEQVEVTVAISQREQPNYAELPPPPIDADVARKVLYLHQVYQIAGNPATSAAGMSGLAPMQGFATLRTAVKSILNQDLITAIRDNIDRMPPEMVVPQATQVLASTDRANRQYLLDQDSLRKQYDAWEESWKRLEASRQSAQQASQLTGFEPLQGPQLGAIEPTTPAKQLLIPPSLQQHASIVRKYAQQYQVPEEYIWSIMMVENPAGNPQIVSPTGDIGLMQINAESYPQWTPEQLQNPDFNVMVGTEILARNLQTYGDLTKAAVAYNQGHWTPERQANSAGKLYLKKLNETYSSLTGSPLDGAVAPPGMAPRITSVDELQDYVYNKMAELDELDPEDPLYYDKVDALNGQIANAHNSWKLFRDAAGVLSADKAADIGLRREELAQQASQFGQTHGLASEAFKAGREEFGLTHQRQIDEERRRLQTSLAELKMSGSTLMGNMYQSANQNFLSAAKSAIPPGQQYAPGFEPNGLAASLSQRYGVPFTPTGGTPFNAGTGLGETAASVQATIQQLQQQLAAQGIQ